MTWSREESLSFVQDVGGDLSGFISLLLVSADGAALEGEAAFHPNPCFGRFLQSAGTAQYTRGEPIPGRVWEAETGLLIPGLDYRVLAETVKPCAADFVLKAKPHSMMIVPVWRGGLVIGTLAAYRAPPSLPFTEEDLRRLERWAARLPGHIGAFGTEPQPRRIRGSAPGRAPPAQVFSFQPPTGRH